MLDKLRKAFYLGVSAASVSKRLVERNVNSYVKSGNISEREGKKLVKKVLAELKKEVMHLEVEIAGTQKKVEKKIEHINKITN